MCPPVQQVFPLRGHLCYFPEHLNFVALLPEISITPAAQRWY
jgi:hypothetical protein